MAENTRSVLERTAADQWKVLPSGLTVLVRPMPGYSGTHVIYATRFGSIDRDFRLGEREVHLPAGVAHFLEHKMFEDEDGDAFAKFAKTGANANAFTAFDRTCYLFTATEQLDESLDVLLGMVGHPYFTEQTIAKEQGIIGQEIKMYDDSPDWRLITGLCECLYHSHPIRSDIAGTVESIAEITPEMLYDCCRAFYAPGNMVLAAAGNTSMEQILAACARHGLMDERPAEKVERLLRPEPISIFSESKLFVYRALDSIIKKNRNMTCIRYRAMLKYRRFYTWSARDIPQRLTQYRMNLKIGGNYYVIKKRKTGYYERICQI